MKTHPFSRFRSAADPDADLVNAPSGSHSLCFAKLRVIITPFDAQIPN